MTIRTKFRGLISVIRNITLCITMLLLISAIYAQNQDPAQITKAEKYIEESAKMWDSKDYEQSIKLAQQALDIYKQQLGEKDPKTIKVQERITQAQTVLSQSTQSQTIAKDPQQIAKAQELLKDSSAKWQTGEYAKSIESAEQAYEILKTQLGEADPKTTQVATQISTAKKTLDQINASKQAETQKSETTAQPQMDAASAANDMLKADELVKKSVKLWNDFEYENSITELKNAYDIYNKWLGKDHEKTKTTKLQIEQATASLDKINTELKSADALMDEFGKKWAAGNIEKSVETAKQAYDIYLKYKGRKDLKTQQIKSLIDKATGMDKKESEDPSILMTAPPNETNDLAIERAKKLLEASSKKWIEGDKEKSLLFGNAALEIYTKIKGATDPDTAKIKTMLEDAKQKEPPKPQPGDQTPVPSITPAATLTPIPDDPKSKEIAQADQLMNEVEQKMQSFEYTEAQKPALMALEIYKRQLGEKDPKTMQCLEKTSNILLKIKEADLIIASKNIEEAKTKWAQGKYQDSVDLAKQSYIIRKKYLGDEHAKTKEVLKTITDAEAYMKSQGQTPSSTIPITTPAPVTPAPAATTGTAPGAAQAPAPTPTQADEGF